MRAGAPAIRGVAKAVRKIYEDHPYPTADAQNADPFWRLPPPDWIADLHQSAEPYPPRILAAGCGTGNEAFALARQFPKSEIVGIDFCASSIATARRLQHSTGLRRISFTVGDLSDRQLPKRIDARFDLISCHGVLAYIPGRKAALQNFADLLTPGGALYLGVNGAAHFSTRWRQALPAFGLDITRMPGEKSLPQVVALLDALSGDRIAPVARSEPSFLPTDLFGPLISALSLPAWVEECRNVGLHFWGNFNDRAPFRATVQGERYLTFIPRSRAEVAQIIDAVSPSQFHHMLLGKRVAVAPPWNDPCELARWRPVLARHLRNLPVPKRRGPRQAIRAFKIRSRLTNTLLELRTNDWVLEVVREARGEKSLGRILLDSSGAIRNSALRKHLYLLHQLYFLELLPPLADRA